MISIVVVMLVFSKLVYNIKFLKLLEILFCCTILAMTLEPTVTASLSPVLANGILRAKQPLNYSIYYKKIPLSLILLPRKLRKSFLASVKRFRIVLMTFSIFLFILFQTITIGVAIIIALINKKSETLFIYTLINH